MSVCVCVCACTRVTVPAHAFLYFLIVAAVRYVVFIELLASFHRVRIPLCSVRTFIVEY